MKASVLKKGMVIWIRCEVKPGPFPNERRVYVKLDENEWFGFVDVSQLEKQGKESPDRVRATVLAVQNDKVVIGIHGQAPASGPIETTSTTIGDLSPVPT